MEIVAALLFVLGIPIAVVVWLSVRISSVKSETGKVREQVLSLEREVKRLNEALTAKAVSPQAEADGTWVSAPGAAPAPSSQAIAPLPPADEVEPELVMTLSPEQAAVTVAPGPGPAKPATSTRPMPQQVPRAVPPPPKSPPRAPIQWERFMGVKLFAWLGGLALFLALAFFIKYSFDNNLIPPEMRIVIGFVVGLGLIVGGLRLSLSKSPVTAQTLCATGVLVLYADIFASHAFYQLIPSSLATFVLMALITTAAFSLAVRLDAQVVAVLGLVGGFLTPILLSTGVDNPLGLFGYLAILDIGLIAVAFRKKWRHLVLLAAIATALMQVGWVGKFFIGDKIYVAMSIFLLFGALFTVALGLAHRLELAERWSEAAAVLMTVMPLTFAWYLLTRPYPALAARPGLLFSFVFAADLMLLAQVVLRERLRQVQWAAGGLVFILLAVWTQRFLGESLLRWGLAFYLIFAAMHAVFPIVLQRLRPGPGPTWWAGFIPAVFLLLIMMLISRHTGVLPVLVWPCVLLIDLLAVTLAVITASVLAILPVLILTVLTLALWIGRAPSSGIDLWPVLIVVGGFAVTFFLVSVLAIRKIVERNVGIRTPEGQGRILGEKWDGWMAAATSASGPRALIPALSALLPFLLLMMVVQRLPLINPSPVFALGALFAVLLLGLVRYYEIDSLAAVSLLCMLALEYQWHGHHFEVGHAVLPILWYLAVTTLFLIFPFVFAETLKARIISWVVAALSGPAHFLLIYRAIDAAYPNPYLGLVPAIMVLPHLAGLIWLLRRIPIENARRNDLLALFGGVTLFFVTLVFPIQFERQWITLGWALEGVALLWLFRRIPHEGLKWVGVGLLAVAFVRLALNPEVLAYYPRSDRAILNWYFYTYGVTTVCLIAGARLLAPPHERLRGIPVRGLLYGLGTVLAFLLLNIEIADYFSTGRTLVFEFSGNFARDMTYSLAWACFAFGLFMLGIRNQAVPPRWAGLGLLTVTLLKLFLHDLWRLGGLYRVGSLIGLAVVLILVSFIYQRFLSSPGEGDEKGAPRS
jgi:uncharacterized membrane protein